MRWRTRKETNINCVMRKPSTLNWKINNGEWLNFFLHLFSLFKPQKKKRKNRWRTRFNCNSWWNEMKITRLRMFAFIIYLIFFFVGGELKIFCPKKRTTKLQKARWNRKILFCFPSHAFNFSFLTGQFNLEDGSRCSENGSDFWRGCWI